ncbi:MAG: hypothetical protein EOM11_06910 [Erysipelotrichia bacterium]|nr:hypothetical protein [Erysipelotrichia bacterium]
MTEPANLNILEPIPYIRPSLLLSKALLANAFAKPEIGINKPAPHTCAKRSYTPNPVKKAIVMRAENKIKGYFRDGGNFEGAWKSIKRNGKILQDTGRLRDNVVGQVTKSGMQVVNKLSYAKIHNFGGTIKHPGGTPYTFINKRPVFMKKDGNYPANVQFTKPHDIVIPKREFMVLPLNWASAVATQEILDYSDWINKK